MLISISGKHDVFKENRIAWCGCIMGECVPVIEIVGVLGSSFMGKVFKASIPRNSAR